MDLKFLHRKFLRRYGESDYPVKAYFAPGRVNLIGEHTDYNGGYVLPCALNLGTCLLIRESEDDQLSFASENFELSANISMAEAGKKNKVQWVNYPLGIIEQFTKLNKKIKGLEFMYAGDIPVASGLSSSASVELVTAYALNDIFNFNFSKKDLALISHKCEHEFIGVQCGIMDQFTVALGMKDHAMFLNCKTMEYEQVPFSLNDYVLVIVNSNKGRELASSKYNERVKECSVAVENIRKEKEINHLGDLDLESFRRVEHLIQHPDVRKRAHHVVNENYRVEEAVNSLKKKDLISFGKLMKASHRSLRDHYEVTGRELDLLAETAWEMPGVAGARMTGAGFGGCTVNVVHKHNVDNFTKSIKKIYRKKTGLEASFYLTDTNDGVKKISTL